MGSHIPQNHDLNVLHVQNILWLHFAIKVTINKLCYCLICQSEFCVDFYIFFYNTNIFIWSFAFTTVLFFADLHSWIGFLFWQKMIGRLTLYCGIAMLHWHIIYPVCEDLCIVSVPWKDYSFILETWVIKCKRAGII